MKVDFVWIGKEKHPYLTKGIKLYSSRLQHYAKSNINIVKDIKRKNAKEQINAEGKIFLNHITSKSFAICLDENGKICSSVQFAEKIQQLQNRGISHITFLIGGAYGFDQEVLDKCNMTLSLSPMTLPHDLCRLVLLEQVYRAFTILKNEKYHNP